MRVYLRLTFSFTMHLITIITCHWVYNILTKTIRQPHILSTMFSYIFGSTGITFLSFFINLPI